MFHSTYQRRILCEATRLLESSSGQRLQTKHLKDVLMEGESSELEIIVSFTAHSNSLGMRLADMLTFPLIQVRLAIQV